MNGKRIAMNRERNAQSGGFYRIFEILILFSILLSTGCERRELTYYTEAEIEIVADWELAGLPDAEKDYGATAVFYPVEGGKTQVVLMGDRTRKVFRLAEGRYNVVLFNRSFDDFGAIGFRGTESYATLEAYASKRATRNEVITASPEALAADRVEGFEVTAGMLGNGCRLSFTPRKLTKEIAVEVNIKGMNNIRNATCTLSGIAEGVFLATGRTSGTTVTQEFELDNPIYDSGSMWDGTMEATFSVFDFDEQDTHNLHLEASLVDGKTEYEENFGQVDVGHQEDGKGGITVTIEVTTTEPVPDVPREEGSGSGMGAEVEDWGEVEEGVIEI